MGKRSTRQLHAFGLRCLGVIRKQKNDIRRALAPSVPEQRSQLTERLPYAVGGYIDGQRRITFYLPHTALNTSRNSPSHKQTIRQDYKRISNARETINRPGLNAKYSYHLPRNPTIDLYYQWKPLTIQFSGMKETWQHKLGRYKYQNREKPRFSPSHNVYSMDSDLEYTKHKPEEPES
ncbi:hypothetical protein K435DRAFT_805017 [Dendrothele bispora CBS 962.96]|uniref:Uncharacterized protein n=1 Tax=Dendrothele bispora (strain CBS 962.96) TaxID=1314807 RepID=A0A4S8LCX2_DENBC|nr:hypothetical protein K435DRAFT_805017 [Dendrothele bispora CBS 962.96]